MNITTFTMSRIISTSAALRFLLICEGLILLLLTLAMWYDNTIRPQWFWLFWLAIPVFAARWHLTGRVLTHTRLHDILLCFILLTAFNYAQAPLQKESYLAATGRLLAGIWTFIYYVELTRTTRSLRSVTILITGLSLTIAIFALTSSQWVDGKVGYLAGLIAYLPEFDYRALAEQFDSQICSPVITLFHTARCFNPGEVIRRGFFSFNVNEIAGVMTLVTPVTGSIALMNFTSDEKNDHTIWRGIRFAAGISFILLVIALFLGQSRFALAGFIVSMVVLLIVSPRAQRLRWVAIGGLIILVLMQLTLTFNVFSAAANDNANEIGLSGRDERSVSTRLQIWNRGMRMMIDQPLTGVGMYMFRTAVAREPYVIPYFQEQNNPPPHAHNGWIHVGAETGITGLLLYVAAQGVVVWMLWRTWCDGEGITRQIAAGVFCGLLAHAIYNLGDTIALWDRFQFVQWWLIGLAGSVYVLSQQTDDNRATIQNVTKKI